MSETDQSTPRLSYVTMGLGAVAIGTVAFLGWLGYTELVGSGARDDQPITIDQDPVNPDQNITQVLDAFRNSVPDSSPSDASTQNSEQTTGQGRQIGTPDAAPPAEPQRSEAEQALYEQRLRIIAEEEAYAAEQRRLARGLNPFTTPEAEAKLREIWARNAERDEVERLRAEEAARLVQEADDTRTANANLTSPDRTMARVNHTSVPDVPAGWHRLRIGTRIPAALVDEIRSELPGQVRAVITRDIYDSQTWQTLLIPAGTQVIGSYGNDTTATQERLFVYWDTLLFNDGREVTLNTAPATDARGASGVAGRRNSGFLSVFFQSVLLNMAENIGNQEGDSTDLADAARIASGQSTASITERYLSQRIERGARFTVPQGTQINIVVEETIALPPAGGAG